MTDLEGKCISELRAELEAATARLREDLQGQLWNYYGALRDPASALKERVAELEDKLEDLTKAADKSSYQTQADTSWRVAEVERQLATLERQRRDGEVANKEWLQDLSALKHRVANLEMAQSGAARQLKEVQGAQADLQEKLHAEVQQQGLQLKEAQSALKNEWTKALTKMAEMEERLEEQAAKLKEVTSWTAGLKGLEDQIEPMDERLKVLGHDLRQLADLLQREVDDREKGAEDLKRKVAQEEAERTSVMMTTDQKISALTTQTAETLKTLKIEERAAEKIETLGEKIEKMKEEMKEESNLTKEQFETQQRKATEELEQLKRQMQKDLRSFLQEQDSTLQDRVQKQMTELQETILQRMQALISSRTERCQADISRIEKRADQSDAELRSLKELQSATRSATEQKVADFQKEVFAAVQKYSAETQCLKVEHNASHKIEEGQFTSLSTEDKLCADLKAVKEGIDSIKNSVNCHAAAHARLPWPGAMGAMVSGVMTPPSPTISFWPRSQPCSPVSGLRTTGPLLRPSTCNACAGSSGLRTSSVSPPWMRPQTVAVSKAPPPIWVNCPEPVVHMAAPAASHVPALLPTQIAAVASKQSGVSSESSTESHTPGVLAIHCPATPGLPAISGEYYLVAGVCPNGRPLWKHRQQELWLYYGTNHRWFVAGPDAKDWKFKCEAGFIYSDPVVANSSPEQASGWARFQGGLFVADPSVTVSRP